MNKILFYIIVLIVIAAHVLLTSVVTLFLLSTINIVNEKALHFENLKFVEIPVAAVIFIIAALIFIRSSKKLTQFIENVFFKAPPR